MRLYPPVPIERVSPVRSDVLPSGHKALGRMKAVRGRRCIGVQARKMDI
ncbi:unnamed protein product [Brassica rapa]|uniref:Uncharacterized protein n=1 Tax=Brassica campestris TaxID=3711 RepID=A0A3P5ZBT6_BRACM|nr:unnamed protein product [Brassica rapa]VDC73545.1 unnamed protein product [Brassica rapa]